ncbi:MAG: phage/plasmid primase, P4 family [Candidatus Metalachnospira sp.]|nr:phage/plasmid primase, P4 family [Candidatus Metalachnospira sp.]
MESKYVIYTANCSGNQKNCTYPNRIEVGCKEDLLKVVAFDHVCGEFKNNYRGVSNFISSNVVVMDNDNDHSENPADWITAEEMAEKLTGLTFAIVPSRHNMVEKYGKAARPKYHIYFMAGTYTDAEIYSNLKKAIQRKFPFLDENATDAARFIYGNTVTDCIWQDGTNTLENFIGTVQKPSALSSNTIPAGRRNSTLSRFAGRVVKRYGVTEKAHQIFLEEAKKCDPPMQEEELSLIWSSAIKFAKKIQNQEDYVAPDAYNDDFSKVSLKPADYSDIGQAKVVTREYGDELVYSEATDYLRFNGEYWLESKQQAIGAMEEFLDLQLVDALDEVGRAMEALVSSGVSEEEVSAGGKRFEKTLECDQAELYHKYIAAKLYLAFVMKRRDMKYVISALQAAKPMLGIEVSDLDKDESLLNVPGCTYSLVDGSAKEPDPNDYITKQTTVAPGEDGKQLWLDALDTFFCKDMAMIDYVQQIVGMASVGKVYIEALIIAYGEGRNGKSTFWNTIARVLGTYAGNMSADTLTIGCKRNVKPEMAELKGKRLIIAAELEEGMRLNTSVIKQLCSTDDIYAEKKYKDPFKFTPSHTLVLYTNHLPRVGANDEGTWRRLIVIPFNAKIEGNSDMKNYADHLCTNAGPYIMQWIIDGAKKAIAKEYKFTLPGCVSDAIKAYRYDNDWLGHFTEECCDEGDGHMAKSGELYQCYRSYCMRTGEYTRGTADFYSGLEKAGYLRKKTKAGNMICGISLKDEDFLN